MLLKIKSIYKIIDDYGFKWLFFRSIYSLKLIFLRIFPFMDVFFEKHVTIHSIDLFDFNNLKEIEFFLLNLNKEDQNKIISKANQAIDGNIFVFSSRLLNYGFPIKWNYNPLSQKSISYKKKWFHIPDFNQEKGDIKVIWEASRLQHFQLFVRAYMLTKDSKYYQAFCDQLIDWLNKNNYSYGPNYKCGQEATLRMLNTLFAYNVFSKYDLETENIFYYVGKMVELSYKKIRSNFYYAYRCIKNNHTFSEIYGQIVGAKLANKHRRERKYLQLFDEEIGKQFNQDGGYKQYSFNYQRYTFQIIELLLKTHGASYKLNNIHRIEKSVELLYQLQSDKGDLPNYGSNDGAYIFPLNICDYRDYRPTLNSLYAQIKQKRLYPIGKYDEEMLWMSGQNEFEMKNIKRKSFAASETGIFKLQHKKNRIISYLTSYKRYRPSHMDQLHIDLWKGDKNIFCDLGTYSYASEMGIDLSKTISHNTIQVDSNDQMEKISPFLVVGWPVRKKYQFNHDEFVGHVSCQNYDHKRQIIMSDKNYMIHDFVLKDRYHIIKTIFNTPYNVKISNDGFVIYDENQKYVKVLIEGRITIEKSYRSLYYLKKEPINRVIVHHDTCESFFNILFY